MEAMVYWWESSQVSLIKEGGSSDEKATPYQVVAALVSLALGRHGGCRMACWEHVFW
jgi:hypothetical protein